VASQGGSPRADVRDRRDEGNQSEAPTANASGELVEQLRFNADRPLTPLTRNLVLGLAGVAEDVQAILPTLWTEEKIIAYAGSDNVVRTVTVLPEMFTGRVNVRRRSSPRPRSRRSRGGSASCSCTRWAPSAIRMIRCSSRRDAQLLELLQFPDLTRASRPGGVDRVMAEHNLGRLVRGDRPRRSRSSRSTTTRCTSA
jgi:hypothetical protein